jgi:hypothetical protein
MIEALLTLVLVLVIFNSLIWQKGEWVKKGKLMFRKRDK